MAAQEVKVYIYELTKGLARSMSAAFLGKQIDGVWHTGVVVYGQEFFFGGGGIESCKPGGTGIGPPDQIKNLGNTEIPFEVFMDYLQDLSSSTFKPERYHLLDHNCNTFSDEVAQFLTGQCIPEQITNLPQEVLNTPFGAMIKPFLDSMSASPGGGRPIAQQSAHQTPAQQQATSSGSTLSSNQTPQTSVPATQVVTYKETKTVKSMFDQVLERLRSSLSAGDVTLCEEICEYLTATDPDWGLGSSHILSLEKVLRDSSLSGVEKEAVAALLQESLLHNDIIAMLVHDITHTYATILQLFEQHDIPVKEKLIKGLCNCSSHDEGLAWLMPPESNSNEGLQHITLDICRQSVLHGDSKIHRVGAALSSNLTRKQISPELAFDLGCALVEVLQRDIDTDTARNSIVGLCQCTDNNPEVAAIASVSGLDCLSLAKKYPTLKPLCDGRLKNSLTKFNV